MLFFSIPNVLYSRYGGKGRASLFLPMELSLNSDQVLLVLSSFFLCFVCFFPSASVQQYVVSPAVPICTLNAVLER